jgi:hypothetical protein
VRWNLFKTKLKSKKQSGEMIFYPNINIFVYLMVFLGPLCTETNQGKHWNFKFMGMGLILGKICYLLSH